MFVTILYSSIIDRYENTSIFFVINVFVKLKKEKKTFNFNSKNLHKLFIDQLLNVILILILKFSNKEEKNNEKQLKTNKINQKKIKI